MNNFEKIMTMWYESEDDLTHYDMEWMHDWDNHVRRDRGETFSHYLVRNYLIPMITAFYKMEETVEPCED